MAGHHPAARRGSRFAARHVPTLAQTRLRLAHLRFGKCTGKGLGNRRQRPHSGQGVDRNQSAGLRPVPRNSQQAAADLYRAIVRARSPADGPDFTGPYQSWLRVFNLQFRRDRRAIARRSKGQQAPATMCEDIVVAGDLMKEKTRLDGERIDAQGIAWPLRKRHGHRLRGGGRGRTSPRKLSKLSANWATRNCPSDSWMCCRPPARRRKKSAPPSNGFKTAWPPGGTRPTTSKQFLPLDALPGTGQPLEESSLTALLRFAKDLQAALNQFAALADPVLRKPSRSRRMP